MKKITILICLFLTVFQVTVLAQKKLYIANDDHTDFMWTIDSANYVDAFVQMLDRWMIINDSTKLANANPNFQSKWNCDGSYWLLFYEKVKGSTSADFTKLISQVKNGQITVPYSPLVCTYGAMPVEAVLRGMYYAGDLERRFGIDFSMATAMENQTMPLGLMSLWKGSGAKYAWQGVCACDTKMNPSSFENRVQEIYWSQGIDTNKILLKWYEMANSFQNTGLGGYAETRDPGLSISDLAAKAGSATYNYDIAAAFGVGHDDVMTLTDALVDAAKTNTNTMQDVIVSNEIDFFNDFENTYGATLPIVTKTFGNEWDLNCTSLAEISARVKRSLEKLRAAEAMAAIVINYVPTFMDVLTPMRKQAWESTGLYWEHSMGFAGTNVTLEERAAFQRRLEADISAYVNALYDLAKANLGNLITNNSNNKRFFAFNPLGWTRTDYADFEYSNSLPFHVVDVTTALEVPYQTVIKNSKTYIRILASNIPSVGYKVYEIQPGTGTAYSNAGSHGINIIENNYFRVTYTNSGVLTGIIDKINNREVVDAANGKYVNDLGSGNSSVGIVTDTDNGPVSLSVTTLSSLPRLHSTKITLYKDIARLDIDNQIKEAFEDSVLTWSYSFNAPASPEIWHEENGAVIKAKLTINGGHYATKNARYDWSTLNHFASVNENTGYGISLSNQDCFFAKMGNSTVTALDESTTQLNVLAGGKIGGLGFDKQGNEPITSQRFAITTHTFYNAVDDMKKALEHQNALVCDSAYEKVNFLLPNEYSFIKTNNSNALIWTVKPAEETPGNSISQSGTIARVWNLSNADVSTTLEFREVINEAKRTTHVETDMNSITPVSGNQRQIPIELGHDEMKTYRAKMTVFALPIKLLSFTGTKLTAANQLNWKAENEINFKEYVLEKSTDKKQFSPAAIINAGNGTYYYTDNDVNNLLPYYYRLKMINNDGTFSYSQILFIAAAREANDLLIYPNPVTNEIFANLLLSKKQRCQVMIVNAAGAIVKNSTPLFEKGYNTYSIKINDLLPGKYSLVITSMERKYVQPFIKN
jgi:alpha-mannosidase